MAVNATSLFGAATAATGDTRKKDLGQADFLKLMTEQLKNQDPLKPLSNNEFLGQLAQISTAQGTQSLNDSIASLTASLEGDQALKAASLVGHSVLVSAEQFTIGDTGGVFGELDVPRAGRVTLEVTDASGKVVHRADADAASAGPMNFAWDGLADDGTHVPAGSYRVTARVSAGGATEALAPMIASTVDSVSIGSGGLVLNLAGIGPTPLSSVHRIGASADRSTP